MTRLAFLIILITSSYQIHAEHYLVNLSAKNANNPIGISHLSQTKKERKRICLNDQDLSLNSYPFQTLLALGYHVVGGSRWLNALLVQTEPNRVNALKNLPFVTDVKELKKMANNCLQALEDIPPGAFLNSEPQLSMLGIDRLHLAGCTGKGVCIAVFDNGFSKVNELFQYKSLIDENRIKASKNFVAPALSVFDMGSDGEHGSRVLSVMAAIQPPNFIGAAFDAQFLLAVTEDMTKEGELEEWNWLMAAEWADSIGADIISSSLGYATNFTYGDTPVYADMDGKTTLISRAANMAASKGILVVNSAGNEGNTTWRHIIAPADADSCLAVGSVNEYGEYSSFSSMGPTADGRIKPNVAAMGGLTITLLPQGFLKTGNGTSFSCPLIAGLAACLWQADSTLSNMDVFYLIQNSASMANNPDTFLGYGIPSGVKAIEKLLGKTLPQSSSMSNYLRVFPNPSLGTVYLSYFNYDKPLWVQLELFNSNGKKVMSKSHNFEKGYQELPLVNDLEQVPQGVYYLRVLGLNKEIIYENKFVIAE